MRQLPSIRVTGKALIVAVATAVAACSPSVTLGTTTTEGTETTSTGVTTTTQNRPSTSIPTTLGTTDTTTDPGDRAAQTLEIDAPNSTPTWGDPPYQLDASASSGGHIEFEAEGSCQVSSAGMVTIQSVGQCRVTATQPGDDDWAPVSATLTIDVARAKPQLRFDGQSASFVKGLRFSLQAESVPAIPLAYEKVEDTDAFNDESCVVEVDELLFIYDPSPSLAAACAVQVSAAQTSSDYTTPEPVTAMFEIGFPNWNVHFAPLPSEVSYEQTGGSLDVAVFEDSGAAYGMFIRATGRCGFEGDQNWAPASPLDATEPTYEYSIEIPLSPPVVGQDNSCFLRAEAEPLNHYGGIGEDEASFVVVP